ncbi:MAG: hypothetical protein ABIA93_04630 [Candidatus Woesearchaeota archaeon]
MKLFIALLFFGIIMLGSALACTCASQNFEQEYNASDLIFTGKALRFMSTDAQTHEYTFEVSAKWKGELGDQIKVRSKRASAACGYTFQNNQYYVVFAKEGPDGYVTTTCSSTGLLKDASTTISALNAKKKGAEKQVEVDKSADGSQDEKEEETPRGGVITRLFESIKAFFSRVFGNTKNTETQEKQSVKTTPDTPSPQTETCSHPQLLLTGKECKDFNCIKEQMKTCGYSYQFSGSCPGRWTMVSGRINAISGCDLSWGTFNETAFFREGYCTYSGDPVSIYSGFNGASAPQNVCPNDGNSKNSHYVNMILNEGTIQVQNIW